MTIKEKLKREIDALPDELLGKVLKFMRSLEKGTVNKNPKKKSSWSAFALDSGAFDFWLDKDEVEYTLEDLLIQT